MKHTFGELSWTGYKMYCPVLMVPLLKGTYRRPLDYAVFFRTDLLQHVFLAWLTSILIKGSSVFWTNQCPFPASIASCCAWFLWNATPAQFKSMVFLLQMLAWQGRGGKYPHIHLSFDHCRSSTVLTRSNIATLKNLGRSSQQRRRSAICRDFKTICQKDKAENKEEQNHKAQRC